MALKRDPTGLPVMLPGGFLYIYILLSFFYLNTFLNILNGFPLFFWFSVGFYGFLFGVF